MVLAAYPRSGQEPAGVLITEVASADVVRDTVDAWTKADSLQRESVEYGRRTYYRLTKSGKGDQHYVLLENIFAMTDDETELRRVIDRLDSHTAESSESASSIDETRGYRAAAESLPAGCVIRVYFDPRA